MRAVVLACGQQGTVPERIGGLPVLAVPARPGKIDLDVHLREVEHAVVFGTDADLAAVALRLLRTERLGEVSVGFVSSATDPDGSAVRRIYSLPADPSAALRLALRGDVDPVPLIRDDAGGVLVGTGRIAPVRGVAYCDERTALRGPAREIVVEPDVENGAAGAGLVARVVRGLVLKRAVTLYGRAFQLGCVPAVPVSDGVPHPRDVSRWTWYRHTADLRLVRGLA